MSITPEAIKLAVLIPLAATVIYHDVKYRRIPNMVVLSALVAGLAINTVVWWTSRFRKQCFGICRRVHSDVAVAHLWRDGSRRREAHGSSRLDPRRWTHASHPGPCGDGWRSACCLHDSARGHDVFNITRSFKNLCRHSSWLGDATLCYGSRPASHHSLWRRNHGRKFDFCRFVPGLTARDKQPLVTPLAGLGKEAVLF